MVRGHVTKQGSRLVRWAAVEGVQVLPHDVKLRADRDRIAARRGRNIGKVAAARRPRMRISSMPTSEGMTGTRDRDDAATLGASTIGADPTITPTTPGGHEPLRPAFFVNHNSRVVPPDGVKVVRPHR